MSDAVATVADPPFDQKNADIILRSSDNVNFHVFKAILSLSSPVFGDMFSLPQPTALSHHKDNIPIVTVEEDASLLDRLLRYCYPGTNVKINNIEEVFTLLQAASKYEMSFVLQNVGEAYLEFEEVNTKPFAAFALARMYKLEGVAKVAMKAALKYSLEELLEQEVDFSAVSGHDYRQILRYHHKYRIACQELTLQLRWIQSMDQYVWGRCRHGKTEQLNDSHGIPSTLRFLHLQTWWMDHMRRIGSAFKDKGPLTVNVSNFDQVMSDIIASNCATCKERAMGDMTRFGKQFKAQVVSTISNIPLGIEF